MLKWVGIRQLSVLLLIFSCVIIHAQGKLERDRPVQKDDEITFTYEYVWGGAIGFGDFMPIRIVIENPLDNDRGEVIVSSGTYKVRHPVELPSRSLRSFVVYVPVSGNYEEPTIELICKQDRIKIALDPFSVDYETAYDVALISDSASLITFLRIEKHEDDMGTEDTWDDETISFRDFAVLPDRAPERAIGYDGMDLVILGEGSERLGDAEVAAIQRYVLAGGVILFTGGTVSPNLNDPRWSAFVPGTDPVVVNRSGSEAVTNATGYSMTSTFSATKITPLPGTTGIEEDGVPIFWYRQCGMGMVVYWAFDPFQAPFQTYGGRSKLFTDTIKFSATEGGEYLTEMGATSLTDDDYYYYGYYEESDSSVFTVAMPATGKIFVILGAFFVCVVPLNFLLLAKIKRGELAWFTSPIICLVFAGIFFVIAKDLYGAELSSSTKSVVVAHQGTPTAYSIGKQELFFPSGGRYDLKLTGVESITTTSDYVMEYYGASSTDTGFSGDLYDNGEIVAPQAGVSNLSFREINFRQKISWPYQLPIDIKKTDILGQSRFKGRIMNDSPYELINAKIWLGRTPILLGDISPGQSLDIDKLVVMVIRKERYPNEPPIAMGQYCLTAEINGIEVGANIGKEESNGISLLYTFGVSDETSEDGS